MSQSQDQNNVYHFGYSQFVDSMPLTEKSVLIFLLLKDLSK